MTNVHKLPGPFTLLSLPHTQDNPVFQFPLVTPLHRKAWIRQQLLCEAPTRCPSFPGMALSFGSTGVFKYHLKLNYGSPSFICLCHRLITWGWWRWHQMHLLIFDTLQGAWPWVGVKLGWLNNESDLTGCVVRSLYLPQFSKIIID